MSEGPMRDSIDLSEKLATFSEHFSPRTVAQFNNFDVMVVKLKGEFVWHKRDDTDDFFLVLKGVLDIQLRDRNRAPAGRHSQPDLSQFGGRLSFAPAQFHPSSVLRASELQRMDATLAVVKVPNKDTESVVSALIKQSQRLPSELYRSLTWDRGKELADHQRLTLATEVDVYFCDPRCPWQRGSSENTNRLLRQYLPRGTDLSLYSQTKLSAIARQLNERPRKTLLYQTPADKFAECVAATSWNP